MQTLAFTALILAATERLRKAGIILNRDNLTSCIQLVREEAPAVYAGMVDELYVALRA